MKKGFTVSDIHMFSRRSTSKEQMGGILEEISRSDICVLNGDIFDFRWTSLTSISETVDRAAQWLGCLLNANPKRDFYFVCGNHDSYPPFVEKLKELSSRHANLHWEPYYLKIGCNMFLHGDIIDALKFQKSIDEYRFTFHEPQKKGRLINFLYDLLIVSNLHKIIVYVHKKEELSELLLKHLRSANPNLLDGITDIFFGHTHVPFSNYQLDGIRFHNTGSMIRKLETNWRTFVAA